MSHPPVRVTALTALSLALTLLSAPLFAGDPPTDNGKPPEFPPFEQISEGYEKVSSTVDGSAGLYTVWTKAKEAQVLAELPKDFEKQRLFIHNVISGGHPLAGVGILMSGDTYASWKRIGKQLALIEPEMFVRSTGSEQDKQSHDIMYTDRVLLSVPIVTMGPGGGPVIDLDQLLLARSIEFFGSYTAGANIALGTLKKAKSFPHNIELAFEVPLANNPPGGPLFAGLSIGGPENGGRLTELHYSISVLPENTGYKPREADPRVGYFTTFFNDMSRTITEHDTWVRYITRWHIEKADDSLASSPPKQPVVWYIEHTMPIRYRRYIRQGLLTWNKAFEKIGIVDAIEVRQQNAGSGAYMDIDPEDVRYNFVRWNNNQASFAIGPSRADPMTGQIFDADLTLNAGILASFARNLRSVLPGLAVEGFTAETMSWLDEHADWDPRVMLAEPAARGRILAERAARRAAGELPDYPPVTGPVDEALGALPRLGRHGVHRDVCLAGLYTAMSGDLVRLAASARFGSGDGGSDGDSDRDRGRDDADPANAAEGEAADQDLLDGLPEDYMAAVIRWVTAHESGHCLGLAHNFMASTIYSLEEINSPDFPADRATGGSVMEYVAPNINYDGLLGETQGQWSIQHVGPYDDWAIDYGYGFHEDPSQVLKTADHPHHVYGTNSDMVGADPRVRMFDFGADPIRFAESRMEMVRDLRRKIIPDFVQDGEGWGRARSAYASLMGQHIQAISVAANWVGGSFIHKDVKSEDIERTPIEDIPAETQRRALEFVIENSFEDAAFGLDSELLYHMNVDRWNDFGDEDLWDVDPAFSSHDLAAGVQTAALTMLLNPTTLRRIHDNELRIDPDEDALTLPEVLDAVVAAAWSELGDTPGKQHSNRKPMISGLRRHLQAGVADRLIGLGVHGALSGAVAQPVGALCREHMSRLSTQIGQMVKSKSARHLDAYTRSHLTDIKVRLDRALEASVVVGG